MFSALDPVIASRAMKGRSFGQRVVSAFLVSALLSGYASGVLAQSAEERSGARAAATEGAQAFRDKKWAEAADLFTRAESLVHAPPHLLYLARAEVNLNQLVKAQENYNKIVRETLPANAPKAFHDARVEAAKELRELEPRIPSVKVVVSGQAPNLKVTMDGAVIPAALVGVQRPTDPGEHKFQASGDNMTSDVTTLVVKEAAKETVTLTLKPGAPPPIAAAPAPVETPATPAAPTGPVSPPPPAPATTSASLSTESSGGSGMKVASFVSFGVGAVGLGLAAAFALKAKSIHQETDDLYNNPPYQCYLPGNCDENRKAQIQGRDDDANSAKKTANLGLVLGGAGLVAGVTFLLLSTSSGNKSGGGERPATATKVTPFVGLGSAGLSGTF